VHIPFAAEAVLNIGESRTLLLRLADSKTYPEAKNFCNNRGGDLATIASLSSQEQESLSQELAKYSSYFWIGLSLSKYGNISSDWRWGSTNLAPSNYMWRSDEPYDFRMDNPYLEGLCADVGAADDSLGWGANDCSA
jgi:hypothetical protein